MSHKLLLYVSDAGFHIAGDGKVAIVFHESCSSIIDVLAFE